MNPVISNTFALTAIKNGSDGNPGGNTATLFLYKRSSTPITAIDWNYALTYNFNTQLLSSVPAGWTLNKIPAGNDPVYVTAATAYSTTDTDSIAVNEWSTPVLHTENSNAAPIFLFKRSASALTAHGITSDEVYYKFSDGKLYNGTGSSATVLTSLNGWERNIPNDNGNACYVIQATALGTGTHDQILHGEWSTPIKLVEDSVILDIDNEMDMVQTDSTGKVSAARNIITHARLFKGSTLQTNPDLPTAASLVISYKDASGNTQSLQPTIINSSGVIEIKWAFTTAMTLTGTMYEKTITVGGKSAIFTLCASHGQPIYQLKPSHSSLPCTRSADHSLSAPPALSLKVLKIDGKSTDEKDATNANLTTFGVTVRYSTSSMPSSKTAGTAWPNDNSVQAANTNTNVYIAMFNSDGTLLDRETIPIVKDGGNGYGIALTLTRNNLYTEANWNTYAEIGHSESYSKRTGDSDLTTCRVGDYFMVTGKASDSNLNHTAIYKCTAVSASSITGTCISHTHDGESAIYADIDNEMDGVACNKDGVTTSAQSVSGYASIWKGSSKQTITALSCKINGNTLGTSYNTDGYRFSYNTSTGYCEVGVNTGITIATKVEAIITVSATIDGASVSRDLTLTINGVRAGANGQPATIYNLLPSPSDVNVGKTDAGEYSPRYNTLKCGYKKSVGSEITSVDEVTGTIDSAYRVFFRRHTRNGDWDTYYYHYPHATYNRYLVVTSGYSTSGLDAATYDKVEFILYKDTSSTSLVASSIDTTKIIDRETVPVVADGQKGDGGPTGNGISSDEFYYCQTTTVEPPQTIYLTETYGWYLRGSANCPTAPTGKNNYLWECRYIQYSVDTSQNKKILRLVLMRDTEVKPNLLEQTAFDSEDSMDKWMHNLGSIENVGEVIPQARGALNAFGAFPTSASEKDFLQQVVFDPGVLAKIKSNEWYTLSFYARTRRYVDMDGNTYGFYFQNIYLKAGTYKLQYNGRCSVSAYNNNVSLNGYLWYSGDHGQTEDWGKSTNTSLLSKADTTVTTGNFTVSVAGYYKIGFYAYKTSGHAGTENDIVHINWWRILSVGDNSQIYTFLYPTAVKNGTTYFVDGVVKSNLPTDCNVCWQLDEDDDDCDNLGWTRHSVTFQTKSSITMAEQNVLFRMYNTYVEICMVKLEQNAMPTEWCENEHDTSTECSHNPCGTWVSGNTYYYCNGVRDVVRALDSANGGYNWFRMKRRTTFLGYKSTIQPYADTDHWEKGNKMKFTIVDSMFAEEIFTDKLTVSRLLTTPDSQGAHIEMHDAEMEIYGKFAFPNIKLGIDDDGCAVLKFFNKDGLLMYDLGPGGIEKTVSQDEVSRFINRYQLLGASDNSDSDLSDAYNYYNRIFNTKIAGNPTSMFFYEAKIVAGQFFAGSYCANADDAEEANKCFFLESASTTASGRKYIQDIAKFTGLVGWSRYGNGQTNGGLFMTDRSWNLCDQTIYEARAVPDDYDTDLDGSSLEVNFMTDYNGYYIDPIYYRTVILFVNGEQKGMRTFYYNKSKVDLIS